MAKLKSFLYFKLGEKATTFVDPKSGLSLVNQQVAKVEKGKARSSKRVTEAVKGGHIEEVEVDEYNTYYSKLSKEEKKALQSTDGSEEKSEEGSEEVKSEKKLTKAEKKALKAAEKDK